MFPLLANISIIDKISNFLNNLFGFCPIIIFHFFTKSLGDKMFLVFLFWPNPSFFCSKLPKFQRFRAAK